MGSTLKATGPLSLPDAPLVTLIQETLLTAVHAQPLTPLTAVPPVPPAAAIVVEMLDRLNVHAAPACVIVNALFSTVRIPTRADDVPLAATA